MAAIRVLREFGPALGRPLVDTIKASNYKNMKELRPPSTGNQRNTSAFRFRSATFSDSVGWWRQTRRVVEVVLSEYPHG